MILHLFYSDDNLIFFPDIESDCIFVKITLAIYESTFGQVVNYKNLSL